MNDTTHPPQLGSRPLCIVMKRKFPCHARPESTCGTDYFFWDVEDCTSSSKGHSFICKKPYENIGQDRYRFNYQIIYKCVSHSISLSGNESASVRSTKTSAREQTMLNLARLLRLRLREGKSIRRQGQRHIVRKEVSSMGRAENRASVKSDRTFAVTRIARRRITRERGLLDLKA